MSPPGFLDHNVIEKNITFPYLDSDTQAFGGGLVQEGGELSINDRVGMCRCGVPRC